MDLNQISNIIFFDDKLTRENLLPLTFTRPLALLRIGITTIVEKWQNAFPGHRTSFLTEGYLSAKYPTIDAPISIFIAGNVLPTTALINAIAELSIGEALIQDNKTIIFIGSLNDFANHKFTSVKEIESPVMAINMLYDIFTKNGEVLASDFMHLTAGRQSQPLSSTCTIVGNATFPDGTPKIFIEEGATIEAATLNVKNGPIYIGRDAEIMEGSCLRGPIALLAHAVVNMGSKIYGATTIGPYSKVGGELNNVVMIGYSNKAHDGFLGNAVIGEWCNLGAGCVASNLKNDYTEIKLWNYHAHRFLRTGLQFCGLIMGDHSKAGINTMFNTATVLGVGVNIHGSGFPRNFVASFSEGSTAGFSDVPLSKFFDIASRVMARRGCSLTEVDKAMFKSIYDIADTYK
jgi:UDP-N-acetylglucosamine diphosphorylase/glucosamine-1-phosphate N-acetyltransferase